MRRILLIALLAASLFGAVPKKPKLVLFLVIDQCRYDYMTKFRAEYSGGLGRLLKKGANFTNDNDDFYPTLTAVSHATMLTGAMPAVHGIVGNDWFDREAGKHVTSVSDGSTRL